MQTAFSAVDRARRHFSSPAGFGERHTSAPRGLCGLVVGAGATGLEPATSGVTGRRSNQLSYAPKGTASIGTGGGLSALRRRLRAVSGRPSVDVVLPFRGSDAALSRRCGAAFGAGSGARRQRDGRGQPAGRVGLSGGGGRGRAGGGGVADVVLRSQPRGCAGLGGVACVPRLGRSAACGSARSLLRSAAGRAGGGAGGRRGR